MKKKGIDYFDMMVTATEICAKAAEALKDMVHEKPENFLESMRKIHDIEREGDSLYHQMTAHLYRSFITPIDREDIMSIFMDIEDTIDAIDEVGILIDTMQVSDIRPPAFKMVDLIIDSITALVKATKEFKNFKKSKVLNQYIVDVNDIEEKGDFLYQQSVKQLFLEERNVLEVVKWKNIYDSLENVLDAAEHVANKLEGVVIKNS